MNDHECSISELAKFNAAAMKFHSIFARIFKIMDINWGEGCDCQFKISIESEQFNVVLNPIFFFTGCKMVSKIKAI